MLLTCRLRLSTRLSTCLPELKACNRPLWKSSLPYKPVKREKKYKIMGFNRDLTVCKDAIISRCWKEASNHKVKWWMDEVNITWREDKFGNKKVQEWQWSMQMLRIINLKFLKSKESNGNHLSVLFLFLSSLSVCLSVCQFQLQRQLSVGKEQKQASKRLRTHIFKSIKSAN